MAGKYTIGIDAGGTRSTAVVWDENGERFRGEGGAMNGSSLPMEQVEAHLGDLLALLQTAGFDREQCAGLCIGAAGTSRPGIREQIQECVRRYGYTCETVILGDGEIALMGAIPEGPGILLIAGTGSVCHVRTKSGEWKRCGGYGHLMDDGGSAYSVGIDILHETVCSLDGRKPHTRLQEAVFRYWKVDSAESLVGKVYAEETGKREIAGLARLLDDPGLEGEACLRRIREHCLDAWMELLQTAAGWLDNGGKLVLAGGLLLKNGQLQSLLRQRLEHCLPQITVCDPAMDAARGAAFYVWEMEQRSGHKTSG